jgi:hypothetical protein
MADWEFEHSAESKADATSVWERYTDVERWSDWSKGVEESDLDGEFEVGSKGTIKAPQLFRTRFELVEVEPERRFDSKAKVPGGTILFEHFIEPANGGTRITHRATLEGPLNFIWVPLIGRIVKRELPESVERLAELAYEKKEEARKDAKEDEERKERLAKADEQFKEEIERTSSGDRDAGGASLPGSVGRKNE